MVVCNGVFMGFRCGCRFVGFFGQDRRGQGSSSCCGNEIGMVVGLQIRFGLWVVMGLLISFGRGFRVEFRWWIMVGSVWWVIGCGGTMDLG